MNDGVVVSLFNTYFARYGLFSPIRPIKFKIGVKRCGFYQQRLVDFTSMKIYLAVFKKTTECVSTCENKYFSA